MTPSPRTHRDDVAPVVSSARRPTTRVGLALAGLALLGPLACARARASAVEGPPIRALPTVIEPSVVASPPADPVRALALAYERSCARMASGVVKCWGLGYDDAPRAWPTTVPGVTQAVQLAVGPTHACARLEDGRLRCFGGNETGALGDGTREPALGATADPGVEAAVDVAVGVEFTCARVVHASLCWGDNRRGSLAHGALGDGALRPTVSPLLSRARAFSLAGRHGLAVVDGGEVLGWGDDAHALIGGAGATKPAPLKLAGLLHVRELSSSASHACARFDSGTVACWGDNDAGQLGDATTIDRHTPAPVLGLGDAAQIAVGERMSCARTHAGAVYCWGANAHGELGDRTTSSRGVRGPVLF
jgi:alpha-tubulin suppressor-like RCC1 family protein